jgi:hypothetical protein
MPKQIGSFELIAREVGSALEPLAGWLASGEIDLLFANLGLRLFPELRLAIAAAVQTASSQATGLNSKIQALNTAVQQGNTVEIGKKGYALGEAISQLIQSIAALASQLQTAAPNEADLQVFAALFPRRLLDFLIIQYLEERSGQFANVLELFGIIERHHVYAPVGSIIFVDAYVRQLHLERIAKLFSNPLGLTGEVYDWGKLAFGTAPYAKSKRLLENINALLDQNQLLPDGDFSGTVLPYLDAYFLRLRVEQAGLLLTLGIDADTDYSADYPLGAAPTPWSLSLNGDLRFERGLDFHISPPLKFSTQPNAIQVGSHLSLAFIRSDSADPLVLLGKADGSRLELGGMKFEAGLQLLASVGGKLEAEPLLRCQLSGGRLIIDTAQAGTLMNALTSGLRAETDFNLGLSWQLSKGLKFDGSANLEVVLPAHVKFGPVTLQNGYLHAAINETGDLPVEISASFLITAGPVNVVIDRIGLQAHLSFPDNGQGNLGAAQFDIALKPPSGLGISVEAKVISGGGFISRAEGPPQRFSGALALKLLKIGITAYGALEQTPSGRIAFVMVLGIRFTPGIQIGYGITLVGVGGLVGLNRRAAVDALRERLVSGASGSVLFSSDPVKNAPTLLGDLNSLFPSADGIFIVGPTVQLSWLDIARFDLGILIELPGPSKIVLLGIGRIEIGGKDDAPAVVSIRLDIFGGIDFIQKLIAFDAALVNSRLIQVFQLTGQAIFRLGLGDKPYLVLSIGGFHPAFTPEPSNLPALARVALTLDIGSAVRLHVRLEAYLAITSNTFQFGAKLDANITAGPINAVGFISFDALIQFRPFYFSIALAAGFRIRYEGFTLAGVSFKGQLTGPGPMVLSGSFTFEILFIKVSWSDSFVFGEPSGETLTPIANAVAALASELSLAANLETLGGDDRETVLASGVNAAKPLVMPQGALVWRQKRVPLNVTLERFESVPLTRPQALVVESPLQHEATQEWFSPGTFINLAQSEALNQSAFERLDAGLKLGFGSRRASTEHKHSLTVKTLRLPEPQPVLLPFLAFPFGLLDAVAERAAPLKLTIAPPVLKIKDEKWTVKQGAVGTSHLSQTEAHQRVRHGGGGIALAKVEADDFIDVGGL